MNDQSSNNGGQEKQNSPFADPTIQGDQKQTQQGEYVEATQAQQGEYVEPTQVQQGAYVEPTQAQQTVDSQDAGQYSEPMQQQVYSNNTMQSGQAYNQEATMPSGPEKTSGLAIASMVLGILSFISSCCALFGIPVGILSIVFAIISMNQNKGRETYPGKGMAIAGLILSGLAIVGAIAFIVVMAVSGEAVNQLDTFNY